MYKKIAILTISAVYFLILIGGVVRASGSGMGCPDWPKCFGAWIPPTNVDQLPLDYQELFGTQLKGEVEFNVFKTWTEYINRLVGVLIGFLIFATLVLAWREYWKSNRRVVIYSFLAFLIVGIEGILGSKVVSSELNPVLITIHMLLAILIVVCLIYALYLSDYSVDKQLRSTNGSLKFIVLILMFLSFGQLVLGTQIREKVDILSSNFVPRLDWIRLIEGGQFYFHIVIGVIVLLGHLWIYKIGKDTVEGKVFVFFKVLIFVVVIEFIVGGLLGLMNIPAVLQPLHLTLASVIIGIQFTLFLYFDKPIKAFV